MTPRGPPEPTRKLLRAHKQREANKIEYDSIVSNWTWEVVPLPKGRKALGRKWVFTLNRDHLGRIVRYKARLVAKRFSQVEGVDYTETFSPYDCCSTLRTVLAYAATLDLDLPHLDIKTVFLH